MFGFILRRIAVAIPTLLLLIVASFLLMHIAPGGPFTQERALPPQVLANINSKKHWVNTAETDPAELSIISKRFDPAPGTHSIKYSSEIDDIEIIHTAHSRKGFATGAVLAAEFLKGKKGIFSMKEVLGL